MLCSDSTRKFRSVDLNLAHLTRRTEVGGAGSKKVYRSWWMISVRWAYGVAYYIIGTLPLQIAHWLNFKDMLPYLEKILMFSHSEFTR